MGKSMISKAIFLSTYNHQKKKQNKTKTKQKTAGTPDAVYYNYPHK